MRATVGGGKGRDRDSPRGGSATHPAETHSLLLHVGLIHLCLNETPKCSDQKHDTSTSSPALYQPTMSSKLLTNFRKVRAGEQVLGAPGDVLLLLKAQVLDLSQHGHQLRRVKDRSRVRSHTLQRLAARVGLSLGGPLEAPWGQALLAGSRMPLRQAHSVHEGPHLPPLSLRYRSPPPPRVRPVTLVYCSSRFSSTSLTACPLRSVEASSRRTEIFVG